MKFIEKISGLSNTCGRDKKAVRDAALLYGIYDFAPPLAKHIVYFPMPKNVMQEMIKDYKRSFPKELLILFQSMNGADLFWTVRIIGKKKTRIPQSCFSIFGIPLTCDRKHIEPYNISIEDLDRPQGTPDSWLKFGSYYRPDNRNDRLDLYVDTNGTNVYGVEHESAVCNIYKTWTTIDNCLCDIFDSLEFGSKSEDNSVT